MNYAADAAKLYNQHRTQGDVACASPHRLIALMMAGVRRHVVAARQAIVDRQIAHKGESTSAAIALLEELRGSLDREAGGQLATRLDSLYEYMVARLIQANLHDKADIYAEVLKLLGTIEEGWNALPAQMNAQPQTDETIARYFHAAE